MIMEAVLHAAISTFDLIGNGTWHAVVRQYGSSSYLSLISIGFVPVSLDFTYTTSSVTSSALLKSFIDLQTPLLSMCLPDVPGTTTTLQL